MVNTVKNLLTATGALTSASKRTIQKTAEATGDLIGNEIDDKIASTASWSNSETYFNRNTKGKEYIFRKKDSKSMININTERLWLD